MTIEEMLRIALDAHTGQMDLIGNPAILHLMSVCVHFFPPLDKPSALPVLSALSRRAVLGSL